MLFLRCPRFIKTALAGLLDLFLRARILFIQTPVFIIFFATNRCNADCEHCFYRSSLNSAQRDVLNVDAIKKIARSLKNRNSLLITGGEPFLRDDIAQICRSFYRYGRTKRIRIASNGYFTDRIISVCEGLLKDGIPVTIQISLDALGDKHDKMRKISGLFAHVNKTIARLIKMQERFPPLEVSVVATVSRANHADIEALADYVREQFGLRLGLVFVREFGSGVYNLDQKDRAEVSILHEEYKLPGRDILNDLLSACLAPDKPGEPDVARDFARLEKTIELGVIFEAKKPPFRCTAAWTDMVLYPNGEVSFCETAKPFCTIRDYSYDVGRLWHSPEARYARKKISRCYCSHPCHLVSSMKHNAGSLVRLTEAPSANISTRAPF